MAGLGVGAWVGLFDASHAPGWAEPQRLAWPDGGPVLQQYAVTVLMFQTIAWAKGEEADHADQ